MSVREMCRLVDANGAAPRQASSFCRVLHGQECGVASEPGKGQAFFATSRSYKRAVWRAMVDHAK